MESLIKTMLDIFSRRLSLLEKLPSLGEDQLEAGFSFLRENVAKNSPSRCVIVELPTLLWKTPARKSRRLSLGGKDHAETTRRYFAIDSFPVFALWVNTLFRCVNLSVISLVMVAHVFSFSCHLKFVSKTNGELKYRK